jgi:H+/Na+-translocating ferredoxin:NAD+ oxidoreductase subunit B
MIPPPPFFCLSIFTNFHIQEILIVNEDAYQKLARVLDTLPNGFPATENGVEIKMLKMIFSAEDADLFCNLRLSFETPEQIAERTGLALEGLEDHLVRMWHKGQVFGIDFGTAKVFKMLP